jgi:hypothetical protein
MAVFPSGWSDSNPEFSSRSISNLPASRSFYESEQSGAEQPGGARRRHDGNTTPVNFEQN